MNELQQVLNDIKQDKNTNLLPGNLKDGVTCLGIEGTLENKVKLFDTVEEMQADSTAKEGDLAVVYREEIQNMTADTQTQYITFPETVTLPEAFTGSSFTMLRAVDESVMFDGNVQLSQTSFRFEGFSETGMISVRYESGDGITYNRIDFNGDSGELTNPVDLGTTIQVYMSEEWNDNMGYFMQVGGNVFDGLYSAQSYPALFNMKYNVDIMYNTENSKTELTSDEIQLNAYDAVQLCKDLDDVVDNAGYYTMVVTEIKNNIVSKGVIYPGVVSLYKHTDGTIYTNVSVAESSTSYTVSKIEFDVNNKTTQKTELPIIVLQVGTMYCKCVEPVNTTNNYIYVFNFDKPDKLLVRCTYDNSVYSSRYEQTYETLNRYTLAPNQYTLTSSNQLLPGISAYGKTGNVTGDGSIGDNIPPSIVLKDILKLNSFYDNGSTSLFKNIFETVGNIENNKEVTYLKRNSLGEYLVLTVNDVITSKTYPNYSNGNQIMKLNDGLRCTDYCTNGFIIRNINDAEPLFTCSTRSKILKLKDNYLYYISFVDNAYKLLKLNTDNYEITEISTLLVNVDASLYLSFNGDYKYAFISVCGGQNNFPGRRTILFDFDTEELVDVLNASYKCNSFSIRCGNKMYFMYKLGSSSKSNIDLLSINLSDGSITKLLTNATSTSFAHLTINTDLELNEAIGEDENYVYLNLYQRLNKATGIITRDMTPVVNDLDLSVSSLVLKKYINGTYYMTDVPDMYLCLCNIQINDTTVTVTGKKYYLGKQAYISIENELLDISILDKTIIGDVCKLQSNDGMYLECTGYTYSLSSSEDYDLVVVNGSTNTRFINQVVISNNILSQEEYNTALDTTEQILGKGKM